MATSIVLKTPEDALDLPKGRLVAEFFEVSFSAEQVVRAAQTVIENNDDSTFYSQAGVIAKAGEYGWGMGDVYRVIG